MYKSFTAEQYKKHLGLPDDYRVDGVLCYGTLYEERTIGELQECLEALGIQSEPMMLANPFLRFARELRIGDKVIWFMLGYGGAWISEYIHWACLFGSKKNILIGSVGGLKPGMVHGDFIIPTSSFGEESSVRIYNRESLIQYADEQLSLSLKNRIVDNQTAVWQGPMVTCQAMLGETAEDVQRWSDAGYCAVEMEASTVFAVSKHFNVPAAACMYISDNLIEQHTVMGDDFAAESHIREMKRRHQFMASIQELLA